MSHVVKINTEFRSLTALKRALKKLGFAHDEQAKSFKYYGNSRRNADLVAHLGNFQYGIGFTGMTCRMGPFASKRQEEFNGRKDHHQY